MQIGITITIAVLCIMLLIFVYAMFTKMQRMEKQLVDYQRPVDQTEQQKQHINKQLQPYLEQRTFNQQQQLKNNLPQSQGLPPTSSNMFQTYSANDLPDNLQEMKLHAAKQVHEGNLITIDPQKVALQKGQNTYINLVAETSQDSRQSSDT